MTKVLSDEGKTDDFVRQCMGMAKRIDGMRSKLRQALEDAGSSKSWDHITNQIGMFAYSGMSKDEVTALRDKHHIYCTLDGRISMAVSQFTSLLFPFALLSISCLYSYSDGDYPGCNIE